MKKQLTMTLALALAAGIFVADIITPTGYADWVLYLIPLLIAYQALNRLHTFSAFETLLIVLGYFLSPRTVSVTLDVANRTLGVFVLWTTSFLLVQRRRSDTALTEAYAELEARVAERTAELTRLYRQNELILESAGEGIFGLDTEGRHTFINGTAAALLGYEVDELIGRHSHSTWHYAKPDGSPYPASECPIYAAYNEGAVHSGEEVFWRKDGVKFPVEFTSTPIYEGSAITGAVVIFRDISERKIIESRLRESEASLRTVLDSVYDAIFIHDLDGAIIDVNDRMLEMYGVSKDQALRFSIVDDYSASDNPIEKLPEIWRSVIGGANELFEWKARRPNDGTTFDVEVYLSRITLQEKDVILASVRDVTERRQAEEELQKALANLEQSNRELQQFVYVASHDLREPLRMVTSYVQLLERRYKEKLDRDAGEFIAYAVDGAHRMQRLIDDLLEYSRVETRGKEFGPVNMGSVFSQAADNLKIAIEESHAEITHGELPVVIADEMQLMQLLQNLIGNAIKFRKKEQPPRIHVSAERNGTQWIFAVRDNGIGIDPAQFGRIFMIFQRLHTHEEYPGTGIGLAVCKKIVERHGGRIWVESQPGEGSAFYFALPA